MCEWLKWKVKNNKLHAEGRVAEDQTLLAFCYEPHLPRHGQRMIWGLTIPQLSTREGGKVFKMFCLVSSRGWVHSESQNVGKHLQDHGVPTEPIPTLSPWVPPPGPPWTQNVLKRGEENSILISEAARIESLGVLGVSQNHRGGNSPSGSPSATITPAAPNPVPKCHITSFSTRASTQQPHPKKWALWSLQNTGSLLLPCSIKFLFSKAEFRLDLPSTGLDFWHCHCHQCQVLKAQNKRFKIKNWLLDLQCLHL